LVQALDVLGPATLQVTCGAFRAWRKGVGQHFLDFVGHVAAIRRHEELFACILAHFVIGALGMPFVPGAAARPRARVASPAGEG
jgi:hypothetical protein